MGYEELGEKLTEFIEYYYDAGYDVEADDSELETDQVFRIAVSNGKQAVLIVFTIEGVSADTDSAGIHISFHRPKEDNDHFVNEVMDTFARITGIPLYHVH